MLIQRESLTKKEFQIPETLEIILKDLISLGTKPMFVGGCVRDFLQNKKIKDYDIEVFNIESFDTLKQILTKYKEPKLVGKSFGVLKLDIDNFDFDFSLPRLEKKIGEKHIDFEVTLNSNLSFKEASKRRDFTINAILYDYFNDVFIDSFNGIEDLEKKVIRHINDKTFIEDSLRVYRAIQFASRFEFEICENTKELCTKIVLNKELDVLPKQRVFEELKKLFLDSKKPSIGFKLIKEFGLLEYFSELKSINFEDILKNIDNLATILKDKPFEDFRKLYLFYSCLCNNLKESQINSFLEKLSDDKKFIRNVFLLSQNSLRNDIKYLKKLSLELKLEDLIILDFSYKNRFPSEIFDKINELNILNRPVKILVEGRDLIQLGFSPSIRFKEILDFAFELQISLDLNKDEIIQRVKKSYKT